MDEEQIQLLSMLMDVEEGGELDAEVDQGFEEKKDGSAKPQVHHTFCSIKYH